MKYLKLYEQFRLITEAIYEDVEVVLSKDRRGVSEELAKSFDIILKNEEVIKNMKEHKMGNPGSMQSFFFKGPGGEMYTKFEWNSDTTAWEVWQQMNYLILTPKNQIHWYHGKKPGGQKFNPIPEFGFEGSKGEDLPKLDISKFGFKVYRALLDDPLVGFIVSEKGSSEDVKKSVYKWLFNVTDYVWIKSGDPLSLQKNPLSYEMVVIMNPKYCNVKEAEEKFRNIKVEIDNQVTQPNIDAEFTYSDNFPKFENYNQYNVSWIEPTDEYFKQELDEFFRSIKYSKMSGSYLHPDNIETMMKLIPKTLTKFAKLITEKCKDLIPQHLQNETDIIELLSNLKEDKLTKTDSGAFSQYLMKLIPICEELKKDKECREEGLNLFRMGMVQDWSDKKIEETGHMGKISSFQEYNIEDTDDPEELKKLISQNPNLKGFLYNVEQFLSEGEKKLPMPFVIRFPSGHGDGKIYSCIGGHKRSSVAIQLGIPMKVWLIDLTVI